MNNREIAVLSTCPLFRGIGPVEVKLLMESVPHVLRDFEKGNMIQIRGDEYTELLILLEGEVSAEIQDFNGKTIKIENLAAPDAMATGILFAEDNTLPVTLVTQKPVHLAAIPKEAVLEMAQKNRKFLLNYFSDSGNRVAFLAEKIRLFKFNSLREKLAGYTMSLAVKQKSDTVRLPYSREKLAELFGVARPSLSRVCSEMAEEGLMEFSGKTARILDRSRLNEICCK